MKLKARTLIGVSEDGKHETPITDVVVNRKGSDIASEAYLRLETAFGDFFDVTGTTTIVGLGTSPIGREVTLRFTGEVTLTSNATSLILKGANITTTAGDVAKFRSLGGGNWVMTTYSSSRLDSTGSTFTSPTISGGAISGLTSFAFLNGTAVTQLVVGSTALSSGAATVTVPAISPAFVFVTPSTTGTGVVFGSVTGTTLTLGSSDGSDARTVNYLILSSSD